MKPMSNSLTILQPGVFIRSSSAQLRSVPDGASESALLKVWREVGPCLGSPKYDGWRFQIHKLGELVKLFSRKGKDWAAEFPSIVQMIRTQVADDQVILDTELVGFDQHGHHLKPSKLRYAPQYRCYLLDALYLNKRDLTSLSTLEREAFSRTFLQNAFRSIFTFAEYKSIRSKDDLIRFYQECRLRRKEGFDGAIIKRLDTPYFADIFKLKPEDTIDTVVVGAYRNEQGVERSLLLAVPCKESKRWVPVAKVPRLSTEWDAVWPACQPHILNHCPNNLEDPPDKPDIWISPNIVVSVTVTELHRGSGYQVHAHAPRECTLREDKGPEDATSFEQVLQMAGLTEKMNTLSEKSKRQQLSLFEEYSSAVDENTFDEDKEAEEVTSFKEILPVEDLMPQANLLNKSPIQLSLFEQ